MHFPEMAQEMLQRLLSRMDGDYLLLCTSSEIADHLKMSQALTPHAPVTLQIIQEDSEHYRVVIVAFDYFSEFSILCGLFSAFGLNIEAGNVQTLFTGSGRKKIVDLFRVRTLEGFHFGLAEQKQFEEALHRLIGMLEQGAFRTARASVNQRLVSQLGRIEEAASNARQPLKGLLAPIEITFDNDHSEQWTRLMIRGKDSPAFLYAFSNALAMRNIYIHKLKISHPLDKIDNQIYISNRQGKKVTKEKTQHAIRISAVFIKQFIHYLTAAPNPSMAMVHFDQFLDKILEAPSSRPLLAFLKKKETLGFLARFFGTSNFLWEDFLRIRFDALFPILEQYKAKPLTTGKEAMQRRLRRRLHRAKTFEEKQQILNHYKDEEMFRIDLRHLHEPVNQLRLFSEALTDLAEVIISSASKVCQRHLEERYGRPLKENGRPSPLAIFGLGKFGGRELGYASDIELLFVYGEDGRTDGPESIQNSLYFEKLSQKICRFIEARQEGIFQIDTRLRPYGKSGRLAVSLAQFQNYYSEAGKAAPFERQALIKLRFAAGSRALGRQCEAARDQFVYSGAPWNLKEAFDLRMRQTKELVPTGRVNVKYSPGGIIDIEYLVQYLQIIHGKKSGDLRTTNTLDELSALAKKMVLEKKTARSLEKTYLFLRSLIDALRMVQGNARDLLLPDIDSDEFIFLARRMGYAKKDWRHGSRQLETAIQEHMEAAHHQYQSLVAN